MKPLLRTVGLSLVGGFVLIGLMWVAEPLTRSVPWLDEGLFWFFAPAILLGAWAGGNIHSANSAVVIAGMALEISTLIFLIALLARKLRKARSVQPPG